MSNNVTRMLFSEVSSLLQALEGAGLTTDLVRRLTSDSSLAQAVVELVQRGHTQVDWSDIRYIQPTSAWHEVAPTVETLLIPGGSILSYRLETPTGITKARRFEPTDDWQDIKPGMVQLRRSPTRPGFIEIRHRL